MSSILCCFGQQDRDNKNNNSNPNKVMSRNPKSYKKTIKILLLGSGESGKSTFIKQMVLIHGAGEFTNDEINQYQSQIYQNIIMAMRILVSAKEKLNIEWEDKSNERYTEEIIKLASSENNKTISIQKFIEIYPKIEKLWNDNGIKLTFSKRNRYQITDNCEYFFDNINRIGSKDYIPTNQDILYCRKASRGITEHYFEIKKIPFMFIDVGGQRSQRQKWFQCFQDITAMLFMVASSEYDQVIYEDRRTNRLVESRSIFETIVNNKCLENAGIILFLNKTDILREKLPQSDIRKYFADFDGDHLKLSDVQCFIVDKFEKTRRNRYRPFFYHFTTAIDTENIRRVFRDCRETILEINLKMLNMQ
uniref:Guanine nucleotide-binding protein subunit alpha n=1 Tax=Parastrongyloides trichosuri TaxID=131310 RepID=A0A0N4ZB70_PARTI